MTSKRIMHVTSILFRHDDIDNRGSVFALYLPGLLSSSFNRMYDWDILTRMMTRTVPRLEFDPYFTTQRERLKHIDSLLSHSALTVYRRHIASRIR